MNSAGVTSESASGRRVFGINFAPFGLLTAVTNLVNPVPPGAGLRLVVTTNVDHVVNLVRNSAFREAYATAWMATADGMPVFLYAKCRGSALPSRVPGPELFAALMRAIQPNRHRPFFVMSSNISRQRMTDWLQKRGFDPGAFAFDVPPFGFERDLTYSSDLAERVRLHGATHLVMGVGSPKSEIWLHSHRSRLGDVYGMGIGAGVDFFVGTEKRAPTLMRAVGAEWIFRILREPRRLYRRYFIDSRLFIVAIKNDLASRGKSAATIVHSGNVSFTKPADVKRRSVLRRLTLKGPGND